MRALLALMIVSVLPAVVRGQTGVVASVTVEQEGVRVVDPMMLVLVETRVGMPVDMRAIRETITHFMSLGRFEDVQVFQDTAPAGLTIRYVLVPAHPIDRIEFRGDLGLSTGDVRRAVVDRFGTAPQAGRVPEVQRTLEAYYRTHGYTAARVMAEVQETHNPDRATLVLDVQAGTRSRIAQIDVEGVTGLDRTMLLTDLGTRVGAVYDGDVVERGLDRYESGLRARGYYEARATSSVRFDAEGAAHVSVIVERGPLVTVVFEGDELPTGERERLVPIRSEASLDEDLLEDSALAIEEYLRARGYRDASVSYARQPDGDRLRLVFTVTRGRRYVIDMITVDGNQGLTAAELTMALGLRSQAPFVQEMLDGGVTAIHALYRSRGFTRPDIRATTTVDTETTANDDRRISIQLMVAEGTRTRIGQVTFTGAMVLSDAQLRQLVTSAPGKAFTEVDVASDRDRLDLEYRNRGYDGVVVIPDVRLREEDTVADVTFAITEGAQAIVDHVIVIGNRRTRSSTIERELTIRSGQPLGAAALTESQQRLAALGLFRRIQVTAIAHPGESRRDVLVQVDEAPPTTLGYGGGVEGGLRLRPTGEGGQAEERFEVAPRGFFEVGRRNLWGKNRAVNLFGRVSLRSRDVTTTDGSVPAADQNKGSYGFNEYQLYATYREPRIVASPVDLLVTGLINQAVRTSFNFISRETRAEAGMRLSPRFSIAARYSFEQTRLFDEQISAEEKPLIDRLFSQVRLSGFSASLIRDTRDDGLYPNHGTFTVVDGEVAARAVGSEVGYVKTFLQTSAFVPLPVRRRMIVAMSARVGAAHGFPRVIDAVDDTGAPVLDANGQRVQEIVQDLPASKRFFAGGDTTVRGFSLDRLGDAKTISPTGFPTGGNGEIILNGELRTSILRQRAEVVGFLDAGNVFQQASDLDITNLRAAAGFGFRYRSPVGPIRVDVGFNLKRQELVPGQLERPYVLHISLGQAF